MNDHDAPALISCPDCPAEFLTREEFVAHREAEHPPAPIDLTVSGIRSQEAVNGPSPTDLEE